MTRHQVDVKQVLREKNARDEADRITRIREVRKLDTRGRFHAFLFDFETISHLDNEDPVYDALAWHVNAMWHDACWCYVWGMFRASIILVVGAIEAGLKYRLREGGALAEEDATFGTCLRKAQQCGLLPHEMTNPVTKSAFELNTLRNNIIHANKARRDPESALSSDGPEHEIIDMGRGLRLISEFRFAARDALKDSRTVLVYLRSHKVRL